MQNLRWLLVVTLLPAGTVAIAQDRKPSLAESPQTTAESFNRALTTGDEKTVRALLLPDVLVYESGGVEASFDEYARHHLPADIAFMSQMKREQLSQSSGGEGATAWVATRSRWRGRFKDKDVDLDSTETLVMTKTASGWRIAHIHWSSAAAKK